MIWLLDNSFELFDLIEPITSYSNNEKNISNHFNFNFNIENINENYSTNEGGEEETQPSHWFLINHQLNIQIIGDIKSENHKNNFYLNLLNGSYTLYTSSQVVWSICSATFDSTQEIQFFFQNTECVIQQIKYNSLNYYSDRYDNNEEGDNDNNNNKEFMLNEKLTFYTTFEGQLSINSISNTLSLSTLLNYISTRSDIFIEFFSSNTLNNSYNIIIQLTQSTLLKEDISLSTIYNYIGTIKDDISQFIFLNHNIQISNISINFKLRSITFEAIQRLHHRRYLQTYYSCNYIFLF